MRLQSTFFSRRGRYHRERGLANQDHGIILKNGGVTVVVLADGAGGSRSGGTAARILVPEIAHWLADTFPAQYHRHGQLLRMELVQRITQCLQAYGAAHHLNPTDLACTLVAMAVDQQGRCLCFHLGDGIIFRNKDHSSRWGVISAPENGLTANVTYLTMNCNMLEHCRLCRFQETGPFRLMAMTDGAAAHLTQLKGAEGWVYTAPKTPQGSQIFQYLNALDPVDDYSFALLEGPSI